MEVGEHENAIAYLSEQLTELKIAQEEHHAVTQERIEEWSAVNRELASCLRVQAQDNHGSASTYQSLVQHLLTFAHITQQLTSNTSALGSSSQILTRYLKEEQGPQLKRLEENNQQLQVASSQLAKYLIEEQAPQLERLSESGHQLQVSSSNLEDYMKTEQSERLHLLEKSIRTLLMLIEGTPIEQSPLPSSQTVTSSKPTTLPVSSGPLPNRQEAQSVETPSKISAPAKKPNYRLAATVLGTIATTTVVNALLLVGLVSSSDIGKALMHLARNTPVASLESPSEISE